jgi:hypothetical protein
MISWSIYTHDPAAELIRATDNVRRDEVSAHVDITNFKGDIVEAQEHCP